MTRDELQLIILNFFAANSGLSKDRIIFKDQRGDAPDTPYGTIKIVSGPKVLGTDEVRVSDAGDDINEFYMSGQRRVLCSFNIYSSLDATKGIDSPGALQLMSNFRDNIERMTVISDLNAQGVSINDRGEVQNLTALLEDVWQERSQLDLTFGYGSNVGDSPGVIEKVGIGGTVTGTVDPDGHVVGPFETDKP